jgi:hypothetical protein
LHRKETKTIPLPYLALLLAYRECLTQLGQVSLRLTARLVDLKEGCLGCETSDLLIDFVKPSEERERGSKRERKKMQFT